MSNGTPVVRTPASPCWSACHRGPDGRRCPPSREARRGRPPAGTQLLHGAARTCPCLVLGLVTRIRNPGLPGGPPGRQRSQGPAQRLAPGPGAGARWDGGRWERGWTYPLGYCRGSEQGRSPTKPAWEGVPRLPAPPRSVLEQPFHSGVGPGLRKSCGQGGSRAPLAQRPRTSASHGPLQTSSSTPGDQQRWPVAAGSAPLLPGPGQGRLPRLPRPLWAATAAPQAALAHSDLRSPEVITTERIESPSTFRGALLFSGGNSSWVKDPPMPSGHRARAFKGTSLWGRQP